MTIEQLRELVISARKSLDVSQPEEMADVVAALAQTEYGSGLADLSAHMLQYSRLPLPGIAETSMKLMLDAMVGVFRLGYVVGKAYQRAAPERIQ